MKIIRVIAAAAILAMPGLAAAQNFTPNILLFDNQCWGSTSYYPQALANMGLAFTKTTTPDSFYAALTSVTRWDLVLVDAYNNPLTGPTHTALVDFIQNGGHCVLNYWGLNETLDAAFGARQYVKDADYEIPLPVKRWNPGHPLLTTPHAIPDLTPVQDTCGIDGYYLEPLSGSTAVAGYTPTAASYQAAIVVGNEGRTILLGITPGLFGPAMRNLLENCIGFVMPPPPPLRLTLNTAEPTVGNRFWVDVAVQPLTQAFDAWGVILGPNNVSYSFTLGQSAALRSGALPLATNVPGLPTAYTGRLFDIAAIPESAKGTYRIIVELVPAGVPPFFPIPGYADIRTVTVK